MKNIWRLEMGLWREIQKTIQIRDIRKIDVIETYGQTVLLRYKK